MARKKKEISTPVPPQEESAAPDQDAQIGYTIGQWAGHTQYKCKQCAFDTLELDMMLEHLLGMHSVILVDGPSPFPPSTQSTGPGEGTERADGIFEIDLKEDL